MNLLSINVFDAEEDLNKACIVIHKTGFGLETICENDAECS